MSYHFSTIRAVTIKNKAKLKITSVSEDVKKKKNGALDTMENSREAPLKN
jgi:hypothetical protein